MLLQQDYRQLSHVHKAQYLNYYSQLALLQRLPQQAIEALASNRYGLFDFYDLLPLDQQLNLSQLKAMSYEEIGDYLAAARERTFSKRKITFSTAARDG